jgi:hypothetical protein
VFTYNRPDNMWLTWVNNSHFKGGFPGWFEPEVDEDVQYIDKHGNNVWEITMQLIEPQFNIAAV